VRERWPKSEVELARVVVGYLRENQWDVYQEVQVSNWVADIVAVNGRLVWVIETKRSLTFDVVDQAVRWQRYSNYVSVAVPPSYSKGRHFAYRVCKKFGIGALSVSGPMVDRPDGNVREQVISRLNRKAMVHRIHDRLYPAHRTYAEAGNAQGRRWSPFRETCDRVRLAVERQPGITMKELIDGIETHYASTASAKSAIAKWVRRGAVAGVRYEVEGRRLRFYPT
jgi:hypothetical protein